MSATPRVHVPLDALEPLLRACWQALRNAPAPVGGKGPRVGYANWYHGPRANALWLLERVRPAEEDGE